MGVDHTAFACYGVRATVQQSRPDLDDINEKLPDGLELVEWGSRCYGGSWGTVLAFKSTYSEVDFDRGVGIRALPTDVRANAIVTRAYDARDVLKKHGIELTFDGDFGWFVGGRTW